MNFDNQRTQVPEFQGFFTIREMRSRGWRITTICDLFVRPHKSLDAGDSPMDLFFEDVVLQLEGTEKFRDLQQAATADEPGLTEVDDRSLDHLRRKPIALPVLRSKAIQYFNQKNQRSPNHVPLLLPPSTLRKIELDYLIHRNGKVVSVEGGKSGPLRSLQSRSLLRELAEMYPHLEEECNRRLTESCEPR